MSALSLETLCYIAERRRGRVGEEETDRQCASVCECKCVSERKGRRECESKVMVQRCEMLGW